MCRVGQNRMYITIWPALVWPYICWFPGKKIPYRNCMYMVLAIPTHLHWRSVASIPQWLVFYDLCLGTYGLPACAYHWCACASFPWADCNASNLLDLSESMSSYDFNVFGRKTLRWTWTCLNYFPRSWWTQGLPCVISKLLLDLVSVQSTTNTQHTVSTPCGCGCGSRCGCGCGCGFGDLNARFTWWLQNEGCDQNFFLTQIGGISQTLNRKAVRVDAVVSTIGFPLVSKCVCAVWFKHWG
jgi:hypothetical protein